MSAEPSLDAARYKQILLAQEELVDVLYLIRQFKTKGVEVPRGLKDRLLECRANLSNLKQDD